MSIELLHTNQRLLLKELITRGAEVNILIPELEIVEVHLAERTEILLDRDSSICPYNTSILCSQKYLVKTLLMRAGLPVPKGEVFYPDQRRDALRYSTGLRYPLVLKPEVGSHGHGTETDIDHQVELEQAIDRWTSHEGQTKGFLIEEQAPGQEYRIFVTAQGKYAVLQREPASVVGDGIHTIHELADQQTNIRANPRINCLCPVVLDQVTERYLAKRGFSQCTVPAKDEKVYLRGNSNLATGGSCEDFTERVNPGVIDLAFKALAVIPGLPYAGIDVMTSDISRSDSAVILEINSNPGIHMHMRPARGQSQNVASYLADLIFPETRLAFA